MSEKFDANERLVLFRVVREDWQEIRSITLAVNVARIKVLNEMNIHLK